MLTRGAGRLWLLFAACVGVLVATMSWLTVVALRLEASEREARSHAEQEDAVRLALWRMDAALGPLIAREAARSPEAYDAFHPIDQAYTRLFQNFDRGDVLAPSELLTFEGPRVLLHFEYRPTGQVASPQAPEGNMRDLAEALYVSPERVHEAGRRLQELGSRVRLADLRDALAGQDAGRQRSSLGEAPAPATQLYADNEFMLRQQQNLVEVQTPRRTKPSIKAGADVVQVATDDEAAQPAGAMRPVWVADELLLVREVARGGERRLQGCWLDWPTLDAELRETVSDLFPEARLAPETDPAATADLSRSLAAIPVRLDPGPGPVRPVDGEALPIRFALVVAWVGAFVAAAALGGLLAGLLALSARRAAFVTAVTHELRTPLTTFRMYTEMLAGGMVAEPDKQRRYLQTLQRESERLSHLVENVLAYARVERGRRPAVQEPMAADALLARVTRSLEARAERDAMDLQVDVAATASDARICADSSVVEQILVNLVDNACKYANGAADRRIHLEASMRRGHLRLRVRDHGPGVSARRRRRLFRAFTKSAGEAAETAPGVGLGLALSRRLARDLGGDLRMEPLADGACFTLTLPTCSADDAARMGDLQTGDS